MKFLDELEMFKRMFELIEKEQTGCTCTFHKRLGISRSKLYNLIDELRDRGIIVNYCKKQKTFYFKEDIRIVVTNPIQIIKKDEMKTIEGGFIIPSIFLDKHYSNFKDVKTLI